MIDEGGPEQLRARGEWFAADRRFRTDLDLASDERSLLALVSSWKGHSVAASTFLKKAALRTIREEKYSAFGKALLSQGFAALAAVEFERANVLGNTSEELYAALAECYRRAGDQERLDETIAVAKGYHRGFRRLAPAERQDAPSNASLQYASWVAWDLPLGQQGHFGINPLWVDDRLIYAKADSGPIISWDPASATTSWIFDPNEALARPPMNDKGFEEGTWRQRSCERLGREGGSILVHYREMELKAPGTGGWGGRSVGGGTFSLDSRTGEIRSHTPAPEDAYRPECPGRTLRELPGLQPTGEIRDVLEDETGCYVLLEDFRLLRFGLGSSKILWQSRIDDPPNKVFTTRNVPMVRFRDVLLIPGEHLGLSALSVATGKLLWKYPVPTSAPIDVQGPFILAACGAEARLVALKIPDDLKGVRNALVRAAQSQEDDALAQELLINMLDLDPSNEAACAALAARYAHRACPKDVESKLAACAKFVSPESRTAGVVQKIIRRESPIRWSVAASGGIEGLAFDRKRTYILHKHRLVAVSKRSGRSTWELPLSYRHTCSWQVTADRLAIGRDALILCTPDNRLIAVDPDSGRVRWTRRLIVRGTKWLVLLNPLAADGKVFASVVCGGGKRGYFFRLLALDPEDGELLWHTDVVPDVTTSDNSSAASLRPAFHGGTAYFPTVMGNLYAVDSKTGEVRWSFIPDRPTRYKHYPIGTPLIDERSLFVVGPTGMLYSLNPDTGASRWQRWGDGESNPDPTRFPLVRIGGNILARRWNNGRPFLRCLDPENGNELWIRQDVHFGYLPSLAQGAFWISMRHGHGPSEIEALDPATGATRERKPLPGIQHVGSLETDGKYLYAIHQDGIAQIRVA